MHVTTSRPRFSWHYSDPSGVRSQSQFEIAVSRDNDWAAAEMWNPGTVTGSDSDITYAGLELGRGGTYFARIRVYDNVAWSPWKYGCFHLNLLPKSPLQVSPKHEESATSHPTLVARTFGDFERDPVTCDFVIYSDSTLQQVVSMASHVVPVDSVASWTVPDALAEDHRYWWKARAWDGYEYSPWSGIEVFWVDESNVGPTAPLLSAPTPGGATPVYTTHPIFRWSASIDPDPNDTTDYDLEISSDPDFGSASHFHSIGDSQLMLSQPLVNGVHYWWRIVATDRHSATSTSTTADFWIWQLGDLNDSHVTDLSDLSALVPYLTGSAGVTIKPRLKGDLNGDCRIDLADLSRLVCFLRGDYCSLLPGC
jgi:hypothetical protein